MPVGNCLWKHLNKSVKWVLGFCEDGGIGSWWADLERGVVVLLIVTLMLNWERPGLRFPPPQRCRHTTLSWLGALRVVKTDACLSSAEATWGAVPQGGSYPEPPISLQKGEAITGDRCAGDKWGWRRSHCALWALSLRCCSRLLPYSLYFISSHSKHTRFSLLPPLRAFVSIKPLTGPVPSSSLQWDGVCGGICSSLLSFLLFLPFPYTGWASLDFCVSARWELSP